MNRLARIGFQVTRKVFKFGPAPFVPLTDARAALRMIRETIEEEFGPLASLESEEAVTAHRGPLLRHEAEAICDAIRRLARPD